jgi:hypothetical protein
MGSREKTLLVVGHAGAGKATLTGYMLFKVSHRSVCNTVELRDLIEIIVWRH